MTVNNDTKTLGPTLLKATLCVTPLLLLLLLNTASDVNETEENKDDVYKLCVQLAVDLLDAVEMIDIVLSSSGRERAQIWNLPRIWHSNDYCCLHKFFAIALANDRN